VTPTVVQEKPKESLCLRCIHLSGDWKHCEAHVQDLTTVRDGEGERLITISCTGFQAKPKSAAQGGKEDER
jgi:hypothetical protein